MAVQTSRFGKDLEKSFQAWQFRVSSRLSFSGVDGPAANIP